MRVVSAFGASCALLLSVQNVYCAPEEEVVVTATRSMSDFVSCFGSSLPQCALQPFGFYENVAQTQADAVELDSYVLVDVRASCEVAQGWEVYGRMENLLDEEYETARRYGSPGRGVHAGFLAEF